ncbi:hypothetical protein D3C71_1730110 [compost metagenome]
MLGKASLLTSTKGSRSSVSTMIWGECGGSNSSARSSRPAISHSRKLTLRFSSMQMVTSGYSCRKPCTRSAAIARATHGGKPIVNRPRGLRKRSCISDSACAASARMACACCSRARPDSVSTTPRPVRSSSFWASSSSSNNTCRLNAGCVRCRAAAARLKLPASATATK